MVRRYQKSYRRNLYKKSTRSKKPKPLSVPEQIHQEITALKSVAEIAEAVLGQKPTATNFWRIVIGIIIFVGIYTFLHFFVWGRRAKQAKKEEKEKEKEKTGV